MKKLLILPLLILLTGCVTYYYPETALEDGVYYAEDDPSYVVYPRGYGGVGYYPWSSLDYFYMGYYPYPGYAWGYSPWYYPYYYYGYYPPHYFSWNYYAAWWPYGSYCSHYNGCRHYENHRGDRHDRYAGRDEDDRHNRDGRDADDENQDTRKARGPDSHGVSPVRRYVSTAPAGYSGNRGMVIRNREETKIGKSYLEPDKSDPQPTMSLSPSNSQPALPEYRSRHSGNETRYRSNAKQTRSHTGPVEAGPVSNGIVIGASPVSGESGQSGPAVTAPRTSGRSSSGSNSSPAVSSRSKTSSGSSGRSRSSIPATSHRKSGASNSSGSKKRD